jgi:hypothetical protein
MHLQVCTGEEKWGNTHACSLTSTHRAGPDGAGRGEAMGAGA